jgi:hypothetical protein
MAPTPHKTWRRLLGFTATWGVPGIVLCLTICGAALLFAHFLSYHRQLWDDPIHDRNAHYLYCLRLATDVLHGDVLALADHLNQAYLWPPLHGVLGAAVLLAGGLDHRLAVVPSLAAWVGLVLFGFLVGRRIAGRGGNVAGLVAALFIAASPAHRAYATDVMLESLGACLSLMVVYAFLCAAQTRGDGRREGRMLGLALTALFLHKYNYWLLVVLALLASKFAECPYAWLRSALARHRAWDARPWLRNEARRPLTWALVAVVGVIGVVAARGPQTLTLAGHSLSLYPPHNLFHIAYVLLFCRIVLGWRAGGRMWARQLNPCLQAVLRWHAWPAALWLLLPRHPSHFLWYISPANHDTGSGFALLEGIRDYTRWLWEDYHANVPSLLLAAALCVAGLLSWRRLRPGGGAALWLVVLGVGLTVTHPIHKGRCLHSWIAAVWVVGGVGLASVLYGRLTARWKQVRPWVGAAALAALTWTQLPALRQAGHALEGGPKPGHPSILDVTDSYVPEIVASGRATVLAAVPFRTLTQWALLERAGGLDRLEEHWWDFGAGSPADRESFLRWLHTTDCDTLVFLERLGDKVPWVAGPECTRHAELLDLLEAQGVFRPVRKQEFPGQHCRLHVWRKQGSPLAARR